MNNAITRYTAEAAGIGHPDKICDQIADAILDKALQGDKNSKAGIEVMASNRLIIVGGELTTTTYIDIVIEAWAVLHNLGYNESNFTIISSINKQSPEIYDKVVQPNAVIGASDQGIVFGFACNDTKELMPLSVVFANQLLKEIEIAIRNKTLIGGKFDMKSQVVISRTATNEFILNKVILSIQHAEDVDLSKFRSAVKKLIIEPLAKKYFINTDYEMHINSLGTFILGGPEADTGLTGRKLMCDTYGVASKHGGGSFSGKDYTKVDRTGAYMARYIAKNIVASKLAKNVEVLMSYEIGNANPVNIDIKLDGIPNFEIADIVKDVFDLKLANIITNFKLKTQNYSTTSIYGHFGRDELKLPWEKLDKVELLKAKY